MRARSRYHDERGAVLVEAAIAGLVVFTFIFGIFEAALFSRAYLATRDASANGARAGTIGANNQTADYEILRAINQSISAANRTQIIRIIVFKPEGTDFHMHTGCDTGGQSGFCNYYVAADLSRPSTDFSDAGTFTSDDKWPASSRVTSTTTGVDRLGVTVTMMVGGLSGPLPDTVSKTTILRLEPHS